MSPTEHRTKEQNVGHGHVFPRPDGVRARCGGPALCHVCAADLARKNIEASVAEATLPSNPLALLPCPFCGGEAVFEQVDARGADEHRWSVGCSAMPDNFMPGRDVLCHGNQSFNTYPRKIDAAKAWNTRPSVSQQSETTGRNPRAQELFAALLDFLNQWKNRDETTTLHEWHLRMKATAARATAVINKQPDVETPDCESEALDAARWRHVRKHGFTYRTSTSDNYVWADLADTIVDSHMQSEKATAPLCPHGNVEAECAGCSEFSR